MSPSRKTQIKRRMRAQPRPERTLSLILQDVEDPVNVGAIFRIADAARVERVTLTGITARPPHKLITKVGRSKDRRVSWSFVESVESAIQAAHEAGDRVLAVELTDEATPYHQTDYPEHVSLLVGHEDHGVTKKALSLCDGSIFIPMYGKGASLNVHVALAVTLFHVLHCP